MKKTKIFVDDKVDRVVYGNYVYIGSSCMPRTKGQTALIAGKLFIGRHFHCRKEVGCRYGDHDTAKYNCENRTESNSKLDLHELDIGMHYFADTKHYHKIIYVPGLKAILEEHRVTISRLSERMKKNKILTGV